MLLQELFALQGMDMSQLVVPETLSVSKVGFMVGNSFTQTVIERILGNLIIKAGLVQSVKNRI